MSIVYPLALPTSRAPSRIDFRAESLVGASESPFSFSPQTYAWPAERWGAALSWSILTRADGDDVEGFLLALNGREGSFLLGDPLRPTPLGTWAGQSPLVMGAGQSGKTLVIDIISGATTGKRGDYFQLGSGVTARLHRLTQDFAASNAYIALPGTAGNYASTPDAAANRVTGDIDIRVKLAATDWTPTANQVLFGKWLGSTQFAYIFWLHTSGALFGNFSRDGLETLSTGVTSAVISVTDGSTLWVRMTRVASTGVTQFFTSTDGSAWVQLGTDKATTAGNIFASSAAVRVGSFNASGSELAANVNYAELRNGISGTVVAALDPNRFAFGALTEVAATGETWTVNQSGSPVARILASATIDFFPRIREIPADNAPLTLASPVGQFMLNTNLRGWTLQGIFDSDISVDCIEDLRGI